MQADLFGDVNGLRSDELQQLGGDARVPGGHSGLGLHQVSPAALQVGGRGAVQGHAGQLVVERAVVARLDLCSLCLRHQTLRYQLVRVGVGDTLTRSERRKRDTKKRFTDSELISTVGLSVAITDFNGQ